MILFNINTVIKHLEMLANTDQLSLKLYLLAELTAVKFILPQRNSALETTLRK